MRLALIAAGMVAALFTTNSAFAGSRYACAVASTTVDTAKKLEQLKTCVREQDVILGNYTTVLKNVWRVAQNSSEIISMLDFGSMRSLETVGGRFQALYDHGVVLLDATREGGKDSFEHLRNKFSNEVTLRSFYDTHKGSMLGKIATVAVKGIVSDALLASLPVLSKPLTLTAASAGEWYHLRCYEPEADQYYTAQCKKMAHFVTSFKDDYGVDATRNNTYVLAWLYRRHLEGGAKLVAEWQRIGNDLAAEYEVAKRDPKVVDAR